MLQVTLTLTLSHKGEGEIIFDNTPKSKKEAGMDYIVRDIDVKLWAQAKQKVTPRQSV